MYGNIWDLIKETDNKTILYSHGMKNRVLLSYLLKFREEYGFDFEAVTFISDRSPKWIREEIKWIMKANNVKHRFIECGECKITLEKNEHDYHYDCVVWEGIKNFKGGIVASSMEGHIKDKERFLMWCRDYNLFPPFIHLNISREELVKEYEKLDKNLISSCYHVCVFCPILYNLGKGLVKSKIFYEKKVLMDEERKEHALNEFYNAMKEYDIGRMVNLVKIYHNEYIRELDELYADYIKSKDVRVFDRLVNTCKDYLRVE
ncbi:conserved hypothetical protein [Methanocaldococcus sp. FS406-22]|uniref:hypothetical protein n=1 Tax=Methanocaldococcus sp. (strain FS406-22) TaxID=644281 RepID=UPI0001BF2469|nr:hypothetical protein [Methanocaldococcus sp. FS406-22]ADC70137.1 conserved hypothetical protein [Methanocaldococcus sp. FS406-22]